MKNNYRFKIFNGIWIFSGILAFIIETAGFFILGLLKPGYDPVLSTVSELGECGGVNAGLASVLFICAGLLELIFALGLYLRLRPSGAALAGSVLLAVNGIFDYISSGFFPCDAGGVYESFSGQMHFFVSVIGMSVMIFPAFFFYAAFRKNKMKNESRLSLVMAVLVLAGAVLFNAAFFTEAAWLGLAQRILGYAYWGWIFLLVLIMPRSGQS
ncbi:MAG: DUF998 domain-containing protein [Spirochaetes bacterium]|nr:DUF998 domain-containing protein [Spirochaetota bacterium]